MINHKFLFPLVTLLLVATVISSQTLSRRAFFGVRMENITDETARVMHLPAVKGVLVNSVVAGSTAEAAGLQKGDIWLTINGMEINNVNEGVESLKKMREGDAFTYAYLRNGERFQKTAVARAYPREVYADIRVDYGAVKANDVLLRSIATRPKKAGKFPAVLFVQGVGCYSLDTPMDTSRAEMQILNNLTRRGFVTFRVDKSGQGDSQGEPCPQLDFKEEAEIYRQALLQLRAMDDVDPDQIFIIGHSMGGVFAPIIARDAPVKGIIAYGTIGVNFMEYFLNSRRNIAAAYEMTDAETDDYIKLHCECFLPYLTTGTPISSIIAEKPQCADILGDMGRDNPFWQQLYQENIPANWSAYTGKVLAIHGDQDFVSTREEHEQIAAFVNKQHPGNGTFAELENCDHGMHIAKSYQQVVKENPSVFNPLVIKTICDWIYQNKA